jgi:hypothetical protein
MKAKLTALLGVLLILGGCRRAAPPGPGSVEVVFSVLGETTRGTGTAGEAAVDDYVFQQIGDAYDIRRLGGGTRYETAQLIACFETEHGMKWTEPVVATGQNFPDALTGAALAGKIGSPLLLVHAASDATVNTLRNHRSSISNFYVLGGEAVIPTSLVNAIANAVR